MTLRLGASLTRPVGTGTDARIRTLHLLRAEMFSSGGRDRRGRVDWDVNLAVTVGPLWGRVMLAYGAPPGSRIGVWITRGGFTGRLRGINVRVGRRYTGPCVTALAHFRRKEAWQ